MENDQGANEPITQTNEPVQQSEKVVDFNFRSLARGAICPKTKAVKALPSINGTSDDETKRLNELYITIQETLIHANNVVSSTESEADKKTKIQEVELMLKAQIANFSYEAFELSLRYPNLPLVLMKALRTQSLLYLPLWRTIEEICDFLTKLLRDYEEVHCKLTKNTKLAILMN